MIINMLSDKVFGRCVVDTFLCDMLLSFYILRSYPVVHHFKGLLVQCIMEGSYAADMLLPRKSTGSNLPVSYTMLIYAL
jgi:hypothetical protein